MKPISEVHVAEPGLAVVEVAACDEQTVFAVQELLGFAGAVTSTTSESRRSAGPQRASLAS
ncbi:DUF6207 family protein [Streptomyces sp. NPDC002671]